MHNGIKLHHYMYKFTPKSIYLSVIKYKYLTDEKCNYQDFTIAALSLEGVMEDSV